MATTLNQREPGRFSSQPRFSSQLEVNLRRHEQAKAVIVLRRWKVIEKPLKDEDNQEKEITVDEAEAINERKKKELTELTKTINLEKYKETA